MKSAAPNEWPSPSSLKRMLVLLLFGLAAILFADLQAVQAQEDGEPQNLRTMPLSIRTSTGLHEFTVQMAETGPQRMKGLMFVRDMAPDHGMLFPNYENQISSFWMKNTYIPLDIIFIRRDGRVQNVAQYTVPFSLESVKATAPVWAVLELNAGMSAQIGMKPGDMVYHPIFGNAPAPDHD